MSRTIARKRTLLVVVAAVAAALTVGVGTASATHLTSLSIAPATQSTQPGGTVTYTGNVGTNTDCGTAYGFNLSASGAPAGSTVTLTSVAPDGALFVPYSLTITVPSSTPDGTYAVTVRADFSRPGCVSGPRTATAALVVDSVPPTITASATSNGSSYSSGSWTRNDVVVHFDCVDNAGGSGVASVTADQTVSTEGAAQSVTGTCVDKSGNSADATFGGIQIDKTAPTVTYTGNAGTYTVADTVAITCNASDALSGVASSTCADVTGPAASFGLGTHTFSATATDNAGNTGSGGTSFVVTADYDSLCALVGQLSTSSGVAQGLCAKLAAAKAAAARGQTNTKNNILGAFANQVDAQTGKALTAEQASLLKGLAATL